jgi:hypothetical protein
MQFTPVVDDTSRGYRFVGDAVISGLLSGVVPVPWRMASQSIPRWNQIAGFIESMRRLRDSFGFAA